MLPARTVGLLTLASLLRVMVTAVLRLLPYRLWQPLLLAAMRDDGAVELSDPALVDRVVSAVVMTERFIPAGQCLERAMTAWLLLRRRATCRIRLGAALGPRGKLFAHAWLEAHGVVVLGTPTAKLSSLELPGSRANTGPKG